MENGQRILIDISPKNLHKWSREQEKILNSIVYQGNANQNQSEISLYATRGWLEPKCQTISAGKDLEQSEYLYAPGRNMKW